MIFHTHCEVCGAETRNALHLRVHYVGFCGSVYVTHPICTRCSQKLESEMYRMRDNLRGRSE